MKPIRRNFTFRSRVIAVTLSLLVFSPLSSQIICGLSADQSGAPPNPTSVEGITAKIVQAGTYTSQMVVLANKTFPAGSDKYNQAFTLYAKAYSAYSAWAAYLTSSLRRGTTKHLNNNREYDGIAQDASNSGVAFTSYVETNTSGESHAVLTILSSLADLGIKLWAGISKQVTQNRNNSALAFCESTKWQSWEEITSNGTPTRQTSDYCKLPSDSTSTPQPADTGSTSPSAGAKPNSNNPKPK